MYVHNHHFKQYTIIISTGVGDNHSINSIITVSCKYTNFLLVVDFYNMQSIKYIIRVPKKLVQKLSSLLIFSGRCHKKYTYINAFSLFLHTNQFAITKNIVNRVPIDIILYKLSVNLIVMYYKTIVLQLVRLL